MFYDAALLTAFVTATERCEMPENIRGESSPSKSPLFFSQLKLVGGGMSYALRLPDGRFILVDGGLRSREDTDFLYNFLMENKGEWEVPRIALWIFTHAHGDHLDLATYFIKTYGEGVRIDSVAHHFPSVSGVPSIRDYEEGMESVRELFSELRGKFSQTKVYTLHTGYRLFYEGVEIEILSTPDNTFIPLYYSFNDMSVILRFKFCNKRSVLLLSDSTGHISRQLAATYGEYLKSDVLQVAHHGLLGGTSPFISSLTPIFAFGP